MAHRTGAILLVFFLAYAGLRMLNIIDSVTSGEAVRQHSHIDASVICYVTLWQQLRNHQNCTKMLLTKVCRRLIEC